MRSLNENNVCSDARRRRTQRGRKPSGLFPNLVPYFQLDLAATTRALRRLVGAVYLSDAATTAKAKQTGN